MRLRLSVLFVLLFTVSAFSQLKIGYVDSEAIMSQLSDAQEARQQLDNIVQDWQNELAKMQSEWKAKYDDYDRRKLIMSDATRAEVEAELVTKEKEIVAYREKKFGTNGDLFRQQEELMKPVQNKVFNAIKEVAKEENYDYVLDRSGGVLVLFAKDELDMTNKVLKKLKI